MYLRLYSQKRHSNERRFQNKHEIAEITLSKFNWFAFKVSFLRGYRLCDRATF